MLWNRWDEVVATGGVRDAVRRRFHTARGHRRARRGPGPGLGGGPRGAQRAVGGEDAARGPVADAADREWLTMCIAIAKAVQD